MYSTLHSIGLLYIIGLCSSSNPSLSAEVGLSLSQTRKKLGFWVTNGVLRETSQDIFEVREDVNNSVSLHFSQHHNLHRTTPALVMGMFDFARNITRLLISDSVGRLKEKIIINIIQI